MSLTGKRVDELTALTTPLHDDLLYIMHDPDATKLHRKIEIGSLRDHFNVKDYGAAGDGVTDDTTAIQAAINAGVAAGRRVFLPPGTYLLSDDVAGASGLYIEGTPRQTVLVQSVTGKSCLDLRTGADVGPVTVRGLTFRATAGECYGIRAEATSWYLTGLRVTECDFEANLYHGVLGKMALCTFEQTFFGHSGTADGYWRPVWMGNVDVGRYAFSNTFRDCKFVRSIGADGAVEMATGYATTFDNCIWEVCTTPAIYARGMTTIVLINPTFEGIDPNGAVNCVLDVADDGLGARRNPQITWLGGRCSQSTGMTDALCYTDSGSLIDIRGAILNVQGYITMRAGAIYDRNANVHGCLLVGYAGTVYRTGELATWSLWNLAGNYAFRIPPLSAEPSFPQEHNLYMDDGTNRGDHVRGLRYYDGAAFRDLGHSGGRAAHSYGGGTTTWAITEKEADNSLFWMINAGGAAIAEFPSVRPGKNFTVYNGSGATITVRVAGYSGANSANGKYSLWTMTGTDCAKIYEQP